MSLYTKPVWELMHKMAIEFNLEKGDVFLKKDVLKWFANNFPLIKPSTITAHLTRMSTNAKSRPHYNAKPETDDLFFKIDSNTFRLYDPKNDPPPIYELSNERKKKTQTIDRQHQIINFYINDNQLRKRMEKLKSAPSDTIIREAGVILEVRLRTISEVEGSVFGKKLVNEVLNPEDGLLIFSDHHGEQDGVRMLYGGAMQFIRNPAMHKLIDYSDNATRIFIQLIDSLLQLLTELDPRHRDDVTLDQVCEMLRLSEISSTQKELFRVLGSAGGEWIPVGELAERLNKTRKQIGSIIGSVGRRVNSTPGLENRGGTIVVFDRKKKADDVYYRMKEILKDALELENIL